MQTVTVAITDDATYEGSETFAVNLSGASGASIADSQGVGTILDDGSAVRASMMTVRRWRWIM